MNIYYLPCGKCLGFYIFLQQVYPFDIFNGSRIYAVHCGSHFVFIFSASVCANVSVCACVFERKQNEAKLFFLYAAIVR